MRFAASHDGDPPGLVLFVEPRGRPLQGRDALLDRLPAGSRPVWIVDPGAELSAETAEAWVQPLSPNDLEHLADAMAATHEIRNPHGLACARTDVTRSA